MPVVSAQNQEENATVEGRITKEGGNASSYEKRIEILQEIYQAVDLSFGE